MQMCRAHVQQRDQPVLWVEFCYWTKSLTVSIAVLSSNFKVLFSLKKETNPTLKRSLHLGYPIFIIQYNFVLPLKFWCIAEACTNNTKNWGKARSFGIIWGLCQLQRKKGVASMWSSEYKGMHLLFLSLLWNACFYGRTNDYSYQGGGSWHLYSSNP